MTRELKYRFEDILQRNAPKNLNLKEVALHRLEQAYNLDRDKLYTLEEVKQIALLAIERTKEEFLDRQLEKVAESDKYDGALIAMQEYADQEVAAKTAYLQDVCKYHGIYILERAEIRAKLQVKVDCYEQALKMLLKQFKTVNPLYSKDKEVIKQIEEALNQKE
jgi:hypothetical protein